MPDWKRGDLCVLDGLLCEVKKVTDSGATCHIARFGRGHPWVQEGTEVPVRAGALLLPTSRILEAAMKHNKEQLALARERHAEAKGRLHEAIIALYHRCEARAGTGGSEGA